MQVRSVDDRIAVVELGGVTRTVYLDVMDEEVRTGDYLIVHAGFAIHRIDSDEAAETLRGLEELGALDPPEESGGER